VVGAGFVVGWCVALVMAWCAGVFTRVCAALARLAFVADRLLGAAVVACAAVGAVALGPVPAVPELPAPVPVVALAAGTSAAVR
jgi:hypothetical protein